MIFKSGVYFFILQNALINLVTFFFQLIYIRPREAGASDFFSRLDSMFLSQQINLYQMIIGETGEMRARVMCCCVHYLCKQCQWARLVLYTSFGSSLSRLFTRILRGSWEGRNENGKSRCFSRGLVKSPLHYPYRSLSFRTWRWWFSPLLSSSFLTTMKEKIYKELDTVTPWNDDDTRCCRSYLLSAISCKRSFSQSQMVQILLKTADA